MQTKQNLIRDILRKGSKEIKFNSTSHLYFVKKENYTSVSKFISPWNTKFINMMDPEHIDYNKKLANSMPFFQKRGTTIHQLSEGVDNGNYYMKWPEALRRYEAYYKLFHRMYITSKKWEILAIEAIVYSKKLKVAGMIDRLFYEKQTGNIILMDLKSGSLQDINIYQQVMYGILLKEMGINVNKLYLLSLKKGMDLHLIEKFEMQNAYDNIQKYIEGKNNE